MSGTLVHTEVEPFAARVRADGNGTIVGSRPLVIARAPGRLDVMGGIADYTGSLVLERTLGCTVSVAAQTRNDQNVVLVTLDYGESPCACTWPLAALYQGDGRLASPEAFTARLDELGCPWAKYVGGVFYTLLESGGCAHFGGGVTLVIGSSVPPRAGVGSSAALEVAVCHALCGLLDVSVAPLDAARLCQRAENLIVKAPCGIMDQVTCTVGEPDTLLQLKCQPHEIIGPLALPEGVTVVGLDSGARHSVRGDRYVDTRVAAFMGHRMIRELITRLDRRTDDPTNGYLANLTPNEYVDRFRDPLPTKVTGLRFLERFGETDDPFTAVCPEKTYKVRSRTEHHIYENARAHHFAERLARARRTGSRTPLLEAGQLMYASHWSYGQRCGLSCVETDLLVNLLRQEGEAVGILGAKVTGGGAGGTVAVLLDDTPAAHAGVDRAAAAYTAKTQKATHLFNGSAPGAHHFGVHHVQ